MASSSYYYNLYKSKKSDVSKYEKNISALQKILNNLTSNLSDEIRNVNNKLSDLKEDLQKSVRHDSKFTSNISQATGSTEKSVSSDSTLRVAVDALEDEISSLTSKKNTAATARDNYYSLYKSAKQEEYQALLDKLKGDS